MLPIDKCIQRNEEAGNNRWDIDTKLEVAMLTEELEEFAEASRAQDEIEMVDGLIDIIFVAVWSLHKMWFTEDQIILFWEEICNSNFTKLPFQKAPNGKIMKSPNYIAPELEKYM